MDRYSLRRTNDWKGVNKLSLRYLDAEIEKTEHSQAWFLWNKGFVVGFCTIEILPYKIAYLTRAAIDFEHQNRGVHTRMIKIREKFARDVGCKKLITYVSRDNIKSIITLVRHDFKIYDPEYAWVGDDYYYFLKEL